MTDGKKKSDKAGLPPGSLVHTGNKSASPVKIEFMQYDAGNLEEELVTDLTACQDISKPGKINWLSIEDLSDEKIVATLGKYYDVHPLVQEDILDTGQRPKMEEYDNLLYFVVKQMNFNREEEELKTQQISILLMDNLVLSFAENDDIVFDSIKKRLRTSKGIIRTKGADYLTYCLLDTVVDDYFLVLEEMGGVIDQIEDLLFEEPDQESLENIQILKRKLIIFRKSIWPLREVINRFQRNIIDSPDKTTEIYLRDLYDHVIQIIDTIETYREVLSSLLDVYLSSLSNKMNEVMKVLTIIATIFIPLTLISGIYGMNFKYMPELEWKWGYFVTLGVMALIGLGMVLFFRKKKWL
ncbi:MAG: magnesium/cobalt transporter CorA [Vulcanimicrobiota bacterium]